MAKATGHYSHDVSHGFHLIMTILTGGAWGIVWIIVTAAAPFRRKRTVYRGI